MENIPNEVQSVVNNVFERFKDFKKIEIRTFVEEMVTFISIIGIFLLNKSKVLTYVSVLVCRGKNRLRSGQE